jgi:hypothetical protein
MGKIIPPEYSFLHTFQTFCPESRIVEVKFKIILLPMLEVFTKDKSQCMANLP